MEFPELVINGTPPDMAGAICEGFVCSTLQLDGEPVASADITYLKFNATWYRLFFECRCVFWRVFEERPLPWEEEDPGAVFTDVGRAFDIEGQALVSYGVGATATGSEVIFVFADGDSVAIRDSNDKTCFEVTPRAR